MSEDFKKKPKKNESGVLTILWRNILTENNLIPALGMLINRYLNNTKTDNDVTPIKKRNKSTLINNINSPGMTFKTFLELIFNFLKAKRLDITIRVTYANGKTSTHSVSVDGSHLSDDDDIEEENPIGENNDTT